MSVSVAVFGCYGTFYRASTSGMLKYITGGIATQDSRESSLMGDTNVSEYRLIYKIRPLSS